MVQGKDKFALSPFQLVSQQFSYALKTCWCFGLWFGVFGFFGGLGYCLVVFFKKKFVKLYPLSVTLQELVWIWPFAMHVTGPVCLGWCLRIKRFGKTHLLFHSFVTLSVALAGFLPAQREGWKTKMCNALHCAPQSQQNLPLVAWQAPAWLLYDGLAPYLAFS